MLKLLLFLVFLVSFGLWAWCVSFALKKLQADLLAGKSFWVTTQFLLLATYAGFFCFLYLLSGFWSLRLVLLFFVAAQLGSLIALLLNAVLGAQSEKSGMRALWAGKEIDIKHPRMSKILAILSGVIVLSYPVVAGVSYFQHTWSSEALKILIVKYSLLLLILGGYPLTMIVVIMMLVSENLDEDTRQQVFVNQLGGMIPTALFVALAIWAFGIGGAGQLPRDFAGVFRTLSFRPLLLMLAFFSFSVLIPYLLGTQRARRRNLALLKERRNYAARLADILESPTGSLYVSRLTGLLEEIAGERSRMTGEDALLTQAEQIEANPAQIPADAKPLVDALEKTRDLDPRFKFLDYLTQFAKELREIIEDLQQRTGANVEQAAGFWSKKFELRKAELADEIKIAENLKPLVAAGLGAVATTIVSGILGEVSKVAWHIISPK